MQTVLDVVLNRFEARYVTFHRGIDELLAVAAPDERDVATLRDKVPNSLDALEYFFGKAGSAWLAPLNAAGFFDRPPATEEGYRVPTWPQSRYLARMAAAEPDRVIGIAQFVADTRNVRVQEDLMKAALAVPPSKAAKLVPSIVRWMASMHLWLQPESIGDLVAQFAEGGEVDAALALGRAFLNAAQAVSGQYLLFDTWHYNRVLDRMVPDLLAVARRSTFDLFGDALDDAIRHYENLGGAAGPEDFSWSWQPTIEGSRDAMTGDVKSLLVSRARDTAEQIAKADPSAVRELVRLLEERPWHVFHRLALHLLRLFPEAAPELIIAHLTDRALFEVLGPSHEYALLAGVHFGNLDDAARARVLTWIADGPTHEGIAALEGHHAVRYAKRWRRDHLAPISAHLPAPWRNLYEGLNLELGPPNGENGELELEGPTSPVSADSLRAMGVEEIAAYVKTWEPSGARMGLGPSRVGLAGELTQLVIVEPERFAASVSHFKGADPTYARAVLSGLTDSMKHGAILDWSAVLDFCHWLVRQPREIVGRDGYGAYQDPHWGWARQAVARLLVVGLNGGQVQVPFGQKDMVWVILASITQDPDPTPADDARPEGLSADSPATRSFNTTRGDAMHAVIQYALWVHRHRDAATVRAEQAVQSFETMPEVRDTLNGHLDLGNDPSPTIRAVYGWHFPWLYLLDPQWTAGNVARIFPNDPDLRPLRDAAWEAYLGHCSPYDDVFVLLHEQYERAATEVGTTHSKRWDMVNPHERFVEHIMLLYRRGKIDADEPDGLLDQFYAAAPAVLRGHAIEFLGRRLQQQDDLPESAIEWMQALWERRLEAARSSARAQEYAPELAPFGWWFSSPRLNPAWALGQLKETLRIVGSVEPSRFVVERLSSLAASMPLDVIECLQLVIDGARNEWEIQG